MSPGPHIESLTALGLTGLEAAVYARLLRSAPETGYRVARAIGKPTANTYKALASLEEKGAVVVGDEARRLYRAVPPDELLDALERRFMDHRRRAAAGLAALEPPAGDDRIYQLKTPAQVLERLRKMLARSRRTAVVDLAPWVVGQVAGDLEDAADAGSAVTAKVYEPVEIAGVEVVVAPAAARDASPERDEPVNAVVDGSEMLLASIRPDGSAVRRAVWTANTALARVLHRAIVAEQLFAAVERGLAEGLSTDELEETFETHRRLRDEPAAG
jgi:sugar-specific transcriptional regulator TrmB